jgi:hypothetical protein
MLVYFCIAYKTPIRFQTFGSCSDRIPRNTGDSSDVQTWYECALRPKGSAPPIRLVPGKCFRNIHIAVKHWLVLNKKQNKK